MQHVHGLPGLVSERDGSAADAALAEKRFTEQLSYYRAGARAAPAAWRVPDSCLAEVQKAPSVRGGKRR
jgi:hypothetical protein